MKYNFLFFFSSTGQTLHHTARPSPKLSPPPPLSPRLLYPSHLPLSPPFLSQTPLALPILRPPSLLSTIPPFSPPPRCSPPPPPTPLPCSRPPSRSPLRLRPAPPHHSHSCPPPPPRQPTPITPWQRRSPRKHPWTTLFQTLLQHVSRTFQTRCQRTLCSASRLSPCRLTLLLQETMNPAIQTQCRSSIPIYPPLILLHSLFSLFPTKAKLVLGSRAPDPLSVGLHHSPSPLSPRTCRASLFQTCPPVPPTLPCTSQIWATKPRQHPPSLLPSLLPPSLTHPSSPPLAWQFPPPFSSLPHRCHKLPSTLKPCPMPPPPPLPPPHIHQ